MQPSRSDLIHSLTLALREYPDGIHSDRIPKVVLSEETADQKMVFFSPVSCSDAGQQLLLGALTKGLKLNADQYQIIVGEKDFQKYILAHTGTMTVVQFGASSIDYPFALSTDTADELAGDREKKKDFWEKLQSL